MSLATIIFLDGNVKQTGEKSVAIKAYKAKHGQLELTPKQAAYTEKIRSVTLPPSWQVEVDNYQPVIHKAVDTCRVRPDGLSTLNDVNTAPRQTNALGGFYDGYSQKVTNIGRLQGKSEMLPNHDK